MADGYIAMIDLFPTAMYLAIRAALIPSSPRRTILVTAMIGATPRSSARAFIHAVLDRSLIDALAASSPVLAAGADPDDFLAEVSGYCHDLMIYGAKGYDWDALGYPKEDVKALGETKDLMAQKCSRDYRPTLGSRACKPARA